MRVPIDPRYADGVQIQLTGPWLPDGGHTWAPPALRAAEAREGLLAAPPAPEHPQSDPEAEAVVHDAVEISEAVERWRGWLLLRDLSPKYIRELIRTVEKAARDCGWAAVQDITAEDLQAYLAELQQLGRSAKTRNAYRNAIGLFCGYAKLQGWIGPNPAIRTPYAKMIRRRARKVPTQAEVRMLISAARRDWRKRDRWLVYLTAACTGLRWGQLRGLLWEHVKLDANPPHLDLPPRLCKNREANIVWLTAELAEALRGARGVRYIFVPNEANRPSEAVFMSVPKTTSFDRDLRAAGLDKGGGDQGTFSFHSLRHFASNRMSWLGFTAAERQCQNQHLTEAMTTEIYTDRSSTELGRRVFGMPGLLDEDPEETAAAPRAVQDAEPEAEPGGSETPVGGGA